MCDHHKPWLEASEILDTAECLYFGDQDGLCRQMDSDAYMELCPQKGRPAGELSAKQLEKGNPNG